MKRTAFAPFYLGLLAACIGCGRPSSTPAPVPASPRLVSLAPNLTEMICAVGAASNLAGRTVACNYPPTLADVPVVGDYGNPSLEVLLALRPDCALYIDLVDKDLPARLRERGLESRHVPCLKLDDIPPALEAVGAIADRPAQGREVANALRAAIQTARAAVPARPRPSVLVVLWADPLYTVGKGSFLSELVDLAGGRNVGDTVDTPYFQASPEWVIRENPDVILCLYGEHPAEVVDRLARIPAFAPLTAVRHRRLYAGLPLDVLLRPGPRVMEGVDALRACLARPAAPGEPNP